MKSALKIASTLGAVCFLMLYSGCGPKSNPAPSVTDAQLALLTKSAWNVTAVTKDDDTQMADYGTFKITFTGTNGQTTFDYTTTGRPADKYPWPQNGHLTFDTANPKTTLTRDDSTPVTIDYSVDATTLHMNFNFAGAGFPGDRQHIVAGQWKFTFAH